MTLLSIAREMAVEIGEETPDTVQDNEPFSRLAVRFINETAYDAIRRVDWHFLTKITTIPGAGENRFYDLPSDYSRLIRGQAVRRNGKPVRGSLSSDEWAALDHIEGEPRYFRATSTSIAFYPYPATGHTLTVAYQSKNWAQTDDQQPLEKLSKDGDHPLLPSQLLLRGAVWRWYRHAGREFGDHMAEYEAMLTDYALSESGMRQP